MVRLQRASVERALRLIESGINSLDCFGLVQTVQINHLIDVFELVVCVKYVFSLLILGLLVLYSCFVSFLQVKVLILPVALLAGISGELLEATALLEVHLGLLPGAVVNCLIVQLLRLDPVLVQVLADDPLAPELPLRSRCAHASAHSFAATLAAREDLLLFVGAHSFRELSRERQLEQGECELIVAADVVSELHLVLTQGRELVFNIADIKNFACALTLEAEQLGVAFHAHCPETLLLLRSDDLVID